MIISDFPPCLTCKHRYGVSVCEAFPDGIPEIIISGGNQHETPLPNQANEIVFEPLDKLPDLPE